MEKIADLVVGQIRIFPVDVVPINVMATKSFSERLKDDLSISEIEVRPLWGGTNTIIFLRGEIKIRNKMTIINKIEVDPRRIILEVAGTSKMANQVYDKLLSSVSSISDNIDLDSLRAPLLLAEETRCTATLDFNYDALFNNSFVEFLNAKVKKATTNKSAECSVMPLGIACEINYSMIDETLLKNKVSMNPKQFTIARRSGTAPELEKYIISSPLDSDAHLKLVRDLNAAITNITKNK